MFRALPTLRSIPARYLPVFVIVAVVQLLDLLTFLPAVAKVGIEAESNPFARALYSSVGPLGPAALKAAAITVMLLGLARIVRRFPNFTFPSAALVVVIGVAGTASNVLFGLLR